MSQWKIAQGQCDPIGLYASYLKGEVNLTMFFQSSVKGSSDSEYLLSPTVRNERKQCEVGDVMENKL